MFFNWNPFCLCYQPSWCGSERWGGWGRCATPARQRSSTSTGSVRNVALLSVWTATRPRREGAQKVSCVYVCAVRSQIKGQTGSTLWYLREPLTRGFIYNTHTHFLSKLWISKKQTEWENVASSTDSLTHEYTQKLEKWQTVTSMGGWWNARNNLKLIPMCKINKNITSHVLYEKLNCKKHTLNEKT